MQGIRDEFISYTDLKLDECEDNGEEYVVSVGGLEKFTRGVKDLYILRYCVLTTRAFYCYTNEWTKKVLFSIPFDRMESVKQVPRVKNRKLDIQTPNERCFIIEVSTKEGGIILVN